MSLPHHFGRIELILGPMSSGKSSEMYRRITRHAIAGRSCLIAKYKKDLRHFSDTFKADPIYHNGVMKDV